MAKGIHRREAVLAKDRSQGAPARQAGPAAEIDANWGLVDILGNPKLSYFVAKALYAPVCVSALHGSVVLRDGDCVEVKASNFGPRQEGASLQVRITDGAGAVLREEESGPLTIEGDGSVTTLGTLQFSGFAPDLYSIESAVRRGGEELARRLEMFYFEP